MSCKIDPYLSVTLIKLHIKSDGQAKDGVARGGSGLPLSCARLPCLSFRKATVKNLIPANAQREAMCHIMECTAPGRALVLPLFREHRPK
jgi:hypothetical protein